MIGGAMLFMGLGGKDVGLLGWPNVLLLIIGIATLGIIYVLFGVVLIVRYNSITDFLIPVSGLATLLQLPFIYFAGWVESPAFLVIPSSAPTMLMQGAFVELTAWQWIYAIGYTTLWIGALSLWAYRAFEKHIVAEG